MFSCVIVHNFMQKWLDVFEQKSRVIPQKEKPQNTYHYNFCCAPIFKAR
jgi:hypothetical protein